MRHSVPVVPQFYVTAPQRCPYLEGRMERKLFTALHGADAQELNDALSKQGFRRSQNVLYRPSCAECSACMSARINVATHSKSRTERRIVKRNKDLVRRATSPWATEEQFALFRSYLDSRHAEGGMADMDVFEFSAMIEEAPIRTRIVEYRDPQTRELLAACLTDVLDDGLSMVYSFFDTNSDRASLGTYIILDHVEIARLSGMPYIYLGYWVPGSPKMAYKARFKGLELYHEERWIPYEDYNPDVMGQHPLSVAPIAEQVANIRLPRSTRHQGNQSQNTT